MDNPKKLILGVLFAGLLVLLAFGWRPHMGVVDPLKVYHEAIAERPDLAAMLTNDARWNRCIRQTADHGTAARNDWATLAPGICRATHEYEKEPGN
jgi:hypothetical protein